MEVRNFQKGDCLIYGDHGICIIEDIREMKAAANIPSRLYVILKPVHDMNSTFYVPADNAELRDKMRDILSKKKIDALLSEVKDKVMRWVDDRNARGTYFREILKDGIQEKMLLMMRCIDLKEKELNMQGKKLPAADNDIYKKAERLVTEEFSYSLEIPPEAVEDYVRAALGMEGE